MTALLAFTASGAFATGQHLPPPPPSAPPIVVPITGTSNSSADAVAQAAAMAAAQAAAQAAANATAIQKQNQNQNLSGSASGVAVTNGGDATTKGGSANQHINGSAGNNRLTTGDSSATSRSGVSNSGNSPSSSQGGAATATGNGAGNVTTLSETTTYEASKFPPQLPAVFLTMSAPCMGSAGGGAGQGVTVINLAFTYSDSECKEIRRVTTLAGALWGMNMRYSAFTVLCTFPKFRENIPTCSQPFPLDDPKQLWGYNPIVVVDHGAEKARAERAEAELARLRQPTTPLLAGITKADLDELKASLGAAATVRVEVPTDKVEKKRVSCKVEEFTDAAGQKVKMCRGPSGSYDVTTVTRDRAVGTATSSAVQATEAKK